MGVGRLSTDLPFMILQRVSKLPRADTGINFAVDAYIPGLYGSHAVPNAAYPHAESQFPVSIWHGIHFCRSPAPRTVPADTDAWLLANRFSSTWRGHFPRTTNTGILSSASPGTR